MQIPDKVQKDIDVLCKKYGMIAITELMIKYPCKTTYELQEVINEFANEFKYDPADPYVVHYYIQCWDDNTKALRC